MRKTVTETTNISNYQSLNFEKGLELSNNIKEDYILKINEYDVFILNECLLKMNKAYIFKNLTDFIRESKILREGSLKIAADRFAQICQQAYQSVENQESDQKVKNKYLEVLNEAKLLKNDFQLVTKNSHNLDKIERFIEEIKIQQQPRKSEQNHVAHKKKCCIIF